MFEAPAFLEQRLRGVLADTFGRIVEAGISAADVAHQLSEEILAATRRIEGGAIYAPDQFTFSMNPIDAQIILASAPRIQGEIARGLRETLAVEGFALAREPQVTLATDPTVARGEVRTVVWRSSNPLTVASRSESAAAQAEVSGPEGAFLIVDGRRHFALAKPVVRIGRRLDNDLVLADLHVSRFHAEVRLREGRYVIVDLNSTAGTVVNGKRVREHELTPGDLVTIARSTLVYGEDAGGPPTATPPYTPPRLPRESGEGVTPLDLKTLTDGGKPQT